MALIDVSDILADPDMVDPIVAIFRKPFVNNFGENELREQAYDTWGSVQPVSGKTLNRVPEALRNENLMSFWVRNTMVTGLEHNQYPEILIARGVRYNVKQTFDWTNWGAGWTEGLCSAEKLNT